MLESRIIYNGVSLKAKKNYIYCYNRNNETVSKFPLTDEDKKRIKAFTPDLYDDMSEHRLLSNIWIEHEEKAMWQAPNFNRLPYHSTRSEYYK